VGIRIFESFLNSIFKEFQKLLITKNLQKVNFNKFINCYQLLTEKWQILSLWCRGTEICVKLFSVTDCSILLCIIIIIIIYTPCSKGSRELKTKVKNKAGMAIGPVDAWKTSRAKAPS